MNIADYQKELRRSENEVAFLHALRVFGRDLPKPEQEFRFAPTRDWRFDLAWSPYLVASEADGGQKCVGGIVGFQGDQRIVELDDIARLNGDFDDRHVLEVADIGDFDFHERCHRLGPSDQYPTQIGEQTAEEVKKRIGSASPTTSSPTSSIS